MLRPHRRVVAALAAALAVLGGLCPSAALAADTQPPATTVPTTVPRLNGTVVGAGVPFLVSWRATDTGSGIASIRLQQRVDGGSWETLALGTPAARSLVPTLRPPHEYQFRVRATDKAGNTGAWSTAEAFRVRRVSEATGSLVTAGPWAVRTAAGYLGNRALRTGSAGATATLGFTGSQVAWFGTRAPNRGAAEVWLDGAYVATVSLYRAATAYRRILFRAAWPESGRHTLEIRVLGTPGHPYVDIDGFVIVDPPAVDPVLVGAGDVSYCSNTNDSKTAKLLDGIAGRVFVPGDVAYPDGTAAQLRECYGPTWGRWRLRTSPAPGNHDYNTAAARPYFDYFGSRAGEVGKGWYAYDLGTWRVYSLNGNCTKVGCGPDSAQVRWLRDDLAANPRECVAAYWHQPLFSSGYHGSNSAVRTLWETLEAAGAEIVVNGHDHDYERFRPQTSGGVASPDGIREFVVGTGGAALRPFEDVQPNSERRNAGTHGVLKLTLRDGSYAWAFVPVAGRTFTDTGTGTCH